MSFLQQAPHPTIDRSLDASKLDIVLPCYNPAPGWVENVHASYQRIQALLPGVEIHLILVNDGSPRGIPASTIESLKERLPFFRYLSYEPNKGKGHALRTGVAHSQHDICIYTDIDFPYKAESLVDIYRVLAAGEIDIAAGIKNQQYYAHTPTFRVRISKLLRFFIRNFLRISITDTQCGLKGFNRHGKALFLETTINRYLCDLEFIFLAERSRGARLKPVPISLKEGVVFSQVNWKILVIEGLNFSRVFLRSMVGLRRKQASRTLSS